MKLSVLDQYIHHENTISRFTKNTIQIESQKFFCHGDNTFFSMTHPIFYILLSTYLDYSMHKMTDRNFPIHDLSPGL